MNLRKLKRRIDVKRNLEKKVPAKPQSGKSERRENKLHRSEKL